MPNPRLSISVPPELDAAIRQDAKDLALTMNSVVCMRLKERYNQILREERATDYEPRGWDIYPSPHTG